MGRFVSATGQFSLTTYEHFPCPPTGSFRCPLTHRSASQCYTGLPLCMNMIHSKSAAVIGFCSSTAQLWRGGYVGDVAFRITRLSVSSFTHSVRVS
jgi:hypothetical protein